MSATAHPYPLVRPRRQRGVLFASVLGMICAEACNNSKSSSHSDSASSNATGTSGNTGGTTATTGGAGTGAFLTLSQLAIPTGVAGVSAADIPAVIALSSDFYDFYPSTDSCVQQSLTPYLISATSEQLTIDFNDTSDPTYVACYNQTDAPAGSATLTSYSVHMYITLSCPGVDLSKWNGQTVASLVFSSAPVCSAPAASGSTVLSMLQTTATSNLSGTTYTTTEYQEEATSAGAPCQSTQQNGLLVDNTCVTTNVYLNTGPGASNGYERYIRNELAGDGSSRYFASGAITFLIDNITGTMTYNGLSTPPTYTASANGTSTSGTFTPAGTEVASTPATPASAPASGTSSSSSSSSTSSSSSSGTTVTSLQLDSHRMLRPNSGLKFYVPRLHWMP